MRTSGIPVLLGVVLLVLMACGDSAEAGKQVPEPQPSTPSSATAPVTPAPTRGSTTAAPRGAVLHQADWSAGLDGWSGSKDWTAVRGELLCAGQDFGLTAGAVAPVEIDSAKDFAVEAEIQLLRYRITNGSFGVMARVQDDGTGYGAGHDEADGVIVLRAEMGGGRPAMDSQPFTPGEGPHRYRLEVRGNELRAFVDGTPVLSGTDNTFLIGKRVGLWSSGAQLSVRSFEVTEL